MSGFQFPPRNCLSETSETPVMVFLLPCPGSRLSGTTPRRALYASIIASMIASLSSLRVSKTNGRYSAFAFFATSSRQICLILSSSQIGSMPGSVQLNSESTASIPPVASTASEV